MRSTSLERRQSGAASAAVRQAPGMLPQLLGDEQGLNASAMQLAVGNAQSANEALPEDG